jgi:hypothetical protein
MTVQARQYTIHFLARWASGPRMQSSDFNELHFGYVVSQVSNGSALLVLTPFQAQLTLLYILRRVMSTNGIQ